MTNKAIPVVRGCGTRIDGGIYAECGFGSGGLALEHFIMCPPQKVDMKALALTKVGVKLVKVSGVWHIFDYVGAKHYPNVADYLEEVRRFGLSRRLPQTLDFSKLTAASRIVLLHERAYVENFTDYVWAKEGRGTGSNSIWVDVGYNRCPKGERANDGSHHDSPGDPPEMCAGVYWQDVEGGAEALGDHVSHRLVTRSMPSFEYIAAERPPNVKPRYSVAAFASFPLSRLVVIEDKATGSHNEALLKAQHAAIMAELEEY